MSFEEIYRQYFSYVYKFILRMSGNESIAEEITSITFFKAMRSIGSFNGSCSISVWLCQIAKNTYYSYVKKHSRAPLIDENEALEIADTDQNPEEAVIIRNEAERARKYIHSITDPYKEVFMWRHHGEMDFRQIGQLFGKSENWACVTYHRARKMLLERMEDSNE